MERAWSRSGAVVGRAAVFAFAVAIAAGAEAVPADGLIASPEPGWPQWRGPGRDGVSPEQGLLPSWPGDGPRRLWKIGGQGKGWSSPIVVNGRIYLTGDVGERLVVCAVESSGAVRWRTAVGRSWTGSYPGARATCVFSEGRLYVMSAHGRVACLDAAGGREVWAVDVLERFEGRNITWAMSECLLVDGPRLIVTPGGRKALMAALDKSDGRTVWTTDPPEGERAGYASPILFRYGGRRCLANCSSDHGFGVDADTGKLLWTVPLQNRYQVNVSTPVYGAGRVYYVTAYAPAVQVRLAADGGGLRAEPAWTHPLDTVTGGAVLAGGVLYAAGYRNAKHWFAVDWTSGRTLAQQKNLTTGAAIYADGRLYCLAEDGTAALVDPSGGELRIVGRFRLSTERLGDAWAHPVLADGRLYLRYHETLWCYDVRAK